MGSLSPALAPLHLAPAAATAGAGAFPLPRAIAVPQRSLLARARRHPWVRLALNGSFSALWTGQLISQFGDRMHQVALFALVYTITGSALATALAFFAATLPNLILSPIAGAYVDRWNTKQVLVVSDILRAAVVLLIPVAVLVNVAFAYPLVFAMTAITIFFRPAKTAILPRIVRDEDLLQANSALWVGETIADVIGYPLAGLFVAFLASSLPLAFWFDAATYLASAVLLAGLAVPKLRQSRAGDDAEGTGEALPTRTSILDDLRVGWRFLRNEPVLLANTLQGAMGQFAIGVIGAVAYVYADRQLAGAIDPEAAFSFLETAIGVGNLAGGLALGLLALRLGKGGLVIAGYLLFGACVVLLGLVSALPLAVGLMVGAGIANMIYVIPSQTLFQERTPDDLIGRVVGFRFALVFGSMALAAPIAGVVADALGPGIAIAFAGLLSLGAGAAGLMSRAVREA
ncbi:MAG: MFS transporter [Chloroflexi bacterium]|nr:MAG: MFS transporter [Chloroflexota bacterium]